MGKLHKKNIEDIFTLTPMQEGLLFHYLKNPGSELYFEQLTLEISGEMNVEICEKAWNLVIETNEMLRTVFRWEKVENPIQIALKQHKLRLEFHDVPGKDKNEQQTFLSKIKLKDRIKKFDLQEVPFRVILCKIAKDQYEMIISNHHILYDGWSNGIILKEFFNAYHQLASGKEWVKPVKTKFKEFVNRMRQSNINEQKKFWRNTLQGFDAQTELAIKRKTPGGIIGTGKYQIRFPGGVKKEIEIFVKKHKITLASFLYTAWGLLLQRYNNSSDVIFGTTVSGRTTEIKGIEDMVGLFINTLPLRVQIHPREKIGDSLQQIHQAVQIRKQYETTPLVSIKEFAKIDNNNRLFDSIVLIENYPLDPGSMTGNSHLSVDSYTMVEGTHYDLTVSVFILQDIEVTFGFNKELFDEKTIMRVSNHFIGMVKDMTANPDKEMPGIEIISAQEKNEILYEFNHTHADYPGDKTISPIFTGQAEQTPDHTALMGENPKSEIRNIRRPSGK